MRLTLREPTAPRFIFINPATNVVHLLLPIISGTQIGLDNTCQSVYAMQEFFGLREGMRARSALEELTYYKKALEFDLRCLNNDLQRRQKNHRLEQVNQYIEAIESVTRHTDLLKNLKQVYPSYPTAMTVLMKSEKANLFSMLLRPKEQDVNLRFDEISPIFSANHDYFDGNKIITQQSILFHVLTDSYRNFQFKKTSKDQLVQQLAAKMANSPVEFETIKLQLTKEIQQQLGFEFDFNVTHAVLPYAPSVPVSKAYIDDQIAVDVANPATHKDYINALLEYCAPNLFDIIESSPFYGIETEEELCLITQFFLGQLNIICFAEEISVTNFGQQLERDEDLVKALALTIKETLDQSGSVEKAIVEFINTHEKEFHLIKKIPPDNMEKICSTFKSNYLHIKKSPHFDEFLLLSDKKGLFATHQGCIIAPFAAFVPLDLEGIDLSVEEFFVSAKMDFDSLEKPNNIIPHKNEYVAGEVELNLSTMSNDELRGLYREINAYRDSNTKKSLLDQFAKERPDFFYATKLLQHVAYGQQNEAEALLLENPEMQHKLLTMDNIPFTDYSGRTFRCSAFEYAYWALDGHMMHMLEKFARQNNATCEFILSRIKAIEEPANPVASSFFTRFFSAPPPPKGLHYTTTDKNGQIIEHNEAHFNFKPLALALKNHYESIKTYMNHPSEENKQLAEKKWIQTVGMAQRDVPAHLAQEYCQTSRSFLDIASNHEVYLNISNPFNLKREIKYYNSQTGRREHWFTPQSHKEEQGIGYSIAICRDQYGEARGSSNARSCEFELWALGAIELQRTEDAKQILKNLHKPFTYEAASSSNRSQNPH